MNNDFARENEQKDLVEQELMTLKEKYTELKMSEEQLKNLRAKIEEAKMDDIRERRRMTLRRFAATAAVLIGAFLVLPNTSAEAAHAMKQIPVIGQFVQVITFRDYKYESDGNSAEIEVPELRLDEGGKSQAPDELQKTADDINAEIKSITDELTEEFEMFLKNEEGYQGVAVKSEVLATTQEYFTLKLSCYQGMGSGYQWNYYYTIDLTTGERLRLKDIFVDGADYITLISNNIKEQMQDQMNEDENTRYWLNDGIEECDVNTITDETSFYINKAGNVVIGFDEGEVAPMYMGAVEFEIPADVLKDIRK